jgi:hypothetical protein
MIGTIGARNADNNRTEDGPSGGDANANFALPARGSAGAPKQAAPDLSSRD